MQRQEVESGTNGSPCLEVGEEGLWSNVGVERLRVPEFVHPHIIDDGKDKLRSLAPRLFVGAAVGALGLVCRFWAHAANGRCIVIDCHAVVSDPCWFSELCAIARCVRCHRTNEADQVLGAIRLVVGHLEEERCQDLLNSSEVSI